MVPVRDGLVRLREAYAAPLDVPEGGAPAARDASRAEVLREVDGRIREGTLVIHQAAAAGFLRHEYRRAGLSWPSPPVVDTRQLLIRNARLSDPQRGEDTLPVQLSRARAAHGLPEYHAGDARNVAVAIAELFLALRLALGARTVRDLRA
jgi:DNA polymerase-3 subunit epsilon